MVAPRHARGEARLGKFFACLLFFFVLHKDLAGMWIAVVVVVVVVVCLFFCMKMLRVCESHVLGGGSPEERLGLANFCLLLMCFSFVFVFV